MIYFHIAFCKPSEVEVLESCEGTLGKGNYIMSPNYPQYYPINGIDCRWTISTAPKKNITLTFIDFNTYYQDSLKVSDGNNVDGTLLSTYSGSSASLFVSSDHKLHLRFTSDKCYYEICDERGSHNGFKIEVSGKCIYYHIITSIQKIC